ncbi:carbamoyl-phosphate synthase (glutamine-hydrolyzing) [Flavobacteriaceae bacterium UJ101]|nr:carbamoyl-phosphate synthase (glutamine-hydrolyzing) [Flavobacteriaceae bacterium UJ101]
MKKNILVTGAGALLGQGILRCLEAYKDSYTIYTADPSPYSSGHWLGDHPFIIPMAKEHNYQQTIEEIVLDNKIEVIFVGTDVELPFFAEKKDYFKEKFNVEVIVSNSNVIEISNDKFKTAEFLRKNGFVYPDSVMAYDKEGVKKFKERNNFPFFAKPVDGARSMGLVKINNEEDLEQVLNEPKNLVIQEFLSDDKGEFTTGTLVVDNQCKAIISLKRDLRDGNTFRTYRDSETSLYDSYIKQIAEKLGVEGPCNFQYRIKNGKPVVFEINGRYSGTTPLRSFYGFNEVKTYLDYIFEGKEIKQPELKQGMVFRTFSDLFIENNEIDKMYENDLSAPQAIYYPFKK